MRLVAHLVRGHKNCDDRRHDEHKDHEDEADEHPAHPSPTDVGADDPSYDPQHAVKLFVPQVRATAIGPATGRIRDIARHALSMGVATVSLPGVSTSTSHMRAQ